MYRAVILDLDGCIYIGSKILEGVRETIEELRGRGFKLMFLTNNSTVSRRMIVSKLLESGVRCELGEVITSGTAAAIYLKRALGVARAYVIGEIGLFEELREEGHILIDDAENVDAVVVGLDRAVSYSKLAEAHRAIRRGALFLATNRDDVLPVEDGNIPGAGAIVAFLEASTRERAVSVGKPERFVMKLALDKLGVEPSEAVMIGDRVDTDIAAAEKVGMRGILVMTGVSKREVPKGVTAITSISELLEVL